MEPILQVDQLTKRFPRRDGGSLEAVDEVSFALLPGEVLGIVGESGSGKSTLARLLLRFLDPTSGSIRLEGQEITGWHGRELAPVYRSMQMVFQSAAGSFDPRQTIGRGIAEGLRNQGRTPREAACQAEAWLERCGLSRAFAHRYPHQLSGGQCQRAAIARALSLGPKVLVCDEVTSALDVTVQRQILEQLGRLQREEGLSCLFICHNLALVQTFCQRVLVMERGRVVEQGRTEQVIQAPRHPYTRRLVEAAQW